jgi:alkylhydroperoxidase/carboxymuconolactone decarboxylase family protein YurZ
MADQNTAKPLTPVDYLAQFSPEAAQSFQSLRKAVSGAGPLDANTCELIALGAFATIGSENSFKTHARRLLKEGVSADAIRQAVLVTFAATTTFSSVIAALHWVDDLVEN